MICSYCQSEFDDNLGNCPVCGAPVPPAEDKKPDYFSQANEIPVQPEFMPQAPAINPLLAKTDMLVKDNLFLALCILLSVAAAIPLFKSFSGLALLSIPSILLVIFFWMIYADSKKGLPNPAHIRLVSGLIYAEYVIMYVMGGLLALMGFLCMFSSSTIARLLTDAFSKNAEIESGLDRAFSAGGWIIGFVFLFTAAVILILNYFSYSKIHKFVKSCYENIQANINALECRNITSVWLIIFAVFMSLSALSYIAKSPLTAVSGGCQTAVCIISYMLLKKYYSEYN